MSTIKKKKPLIIALSILAAIIIGIIIYGYQMLNKVDNVEISDEDEDLGIEEVEEIEERRTDVTNIALFGVDTTDLSKNARSDSIIIASFDRKNNTVKLTSLMRDTYVEIPGRGMDKLNHAYAFGGPELAIKTINQNFKLDIREFMTVDFTGFERIVDSMGGVEIELTQAEANHMKMPNSGRQLLDGKEALNYSRIRKIGNDYERTERQRTVLEEVFKQMLKINVLDYPKVLNNMLPLVETSLTKTQMLGLGTDVVRSDIKGIEQFRLPADGYVQNAMINGVSYVVPASMEDNVKLFQEFVYGEDN